MGKRREMGGDWGRWTVVAETAERSHGGTIRWLCRCKCGTERVVDGHQLRALESESCGCKHDDDSSERRLVHGQAQCRDGPSTPTYRSWLTMRAAVKRGAECVPDWEEFLGFVEDMGERPEGLRLTRLSVDEPYGPDNCEWGGGYRHRGATHWTSR